MTDKNTVRSEFPILDEKIYGKSLIYLDNAATTQKPRCVVEQLEHGYYHINANVHRGVHFLSQQATEAHEVSRRSAQTFINAADPSEIIFTQGTTGSINLIASSYGKAFMQPGDEVIVTAMEHHSNIVPWQMLCNRKKLKLTVAPIDNAGEMDLNAFGKLLSAKTKLVAIAHVSNVLGTVNPVEKIIQMAHARGVPVLVDGAQAAPHISLNVREMDADFYVFSGHKIYAPTGIGVLYGKERWLEALPPYQGGGEMIASVSFAETKFNILPYKFEAGTPDYIGSTALAVAIDYLEDLGLETVAAHEHDLLQYALEQLRTIDGLQIFGLPQERSGVISFLLKGIHHYDTGMLLDRLGVAVRTGHHCAEPLIRSLGIEGTVRASFALYNTREDVDALIIALRRVTSLLSHANPIVQKL